MADRDAPIVRALVVDDEAPGRLNLRYALAAHPNWQLAAECANVAAARTALADGAVDVVFLDIRMPRESGLALARTLCEQAAPPLIIFVTAYDAHALEAFELNALDYLLKPFDNRRFAQTIERAEQMLALQQQAPYAKALRGFFDQERDQRAGVACAPLQRLTVRSVGRIESIPVDDILWFSSAGNYVELHTGDRTVLHRVTLGQLEQHLPQGQFLRVHRTALVRANQCARLDAAGYGSYLLTLRCGGQVPVSERHVEAVRAQL